MIVFKVACANLRRSGAIQCLNDSAPSYKRKLCLPSAAWLVVIVVHSVNHGRGELDESSLDGLRHVAHGVRRVAAPIVNRLTGDYSPDLDFLRVVGFERLDTGQRLLFPEHQRRKEPLEPVNARPDVCSSWQDHATCQPRFDQFTVHRCSAILRPACVVGEEMLAE